MHAPQIIVIGLVAADLGIALVKHGEPQGRYDLWSTVISAVVVISLLRWGGFFA